MSIPSWRALFTATFYLAPSLCFAIGAGQPSRPLTLPKVSSGASFPCLNLSALPIAGTPGGLLAHAVPVGTAQITPLAAGPLSPTDAVIGSTGTAFRAVGLGIPNLQRAPNGTVRWMEGDLGALDSYPAVAPTNFFAQIAVGQDDPGTAHALGLLNAYAVLLRLENPAAEMRPISAVTDELGYHHFRFQQVYRGLPVWGRDLYVHVKPDGQCYAVNGAYEPTPGGLDVSPTLIPADALNRVRSDLTEKGSWRPVADDAAHLMGFEPAEGNLVVFVPDGVAPRLAYAVDIHPNLIEWYTYFVDARDGTILHRIARHCSVFADASGTDLNGQSRTFRTWKDAAGKYFMIWDLPNYDGTKSTPPDSLTGGMLGLTLNGRDPGTSGALTHINSPDNAWTDKATVSAAYNGKAAYDYYRNNFQRKAIDGLDSTVISIVHVTENSQPMDNAFWNGKVMLYGDGNTTFKPLAGGLDVAGHEMTHGVIQHTADLVYEKQSGALNESFADVFGVMIDRSNLLIGEDVILPGKGIALRDLASPGNPQVVSPQPATMDQFVNTSQDNGGVHTNSGIPNHAAALIINAIGREKTEKVYYRALSSYLTRSSQFVDCRNAVERAAKDLYQDGSAEVTAVDNAFTNVGIAAGTGNPGGGNDVPPVTGGSQRIAWVYADGTLGFYDFATNNSYLYSSAKAAGPAGDFSKVSAPRGGQRLWFVDSTRHLAFVDTQSGQVSTFPGVFVQRDGDLASACVSPDESFVAFDSSSTNDPNIYIYNGTNTLVIPLLPETSQEGVKDTSILYPNFISWSPNMAQPKIAFDAYHQVMVNNVPWNWWGINEINFATGRIYDLLPSQPAQVEIGNITYHSTDPDIVAFNAIPTLASADIVLARFSQNQIVPLQMYNYTIEGSHLTDALWPTFSPDGTKIAFVAPSFPLLATLDSAGNLSYMYYPAAVYNPVWFVQGGTLPLTLADLAHAVRLSSGLLKATGDDMARLNLASTGASATRIDMEDSVRIARKLSGIAP